MNNLPPPPLKQKKNKKQKTNTQLLNDYSISVTWQSDIPFTNRIRGPYCKLQTEIFSFCRNDTTLQRHVTTRQVMTIYCVPSAH